MKTLDTIDTYYPNYYHSSWLDFKQKHLLSWQVTPQNAKDYSFEHSYNERLARRYSFRSSHLAISQGYGAIGILWQIGGGCYVITNAQDAIKSIALDYSLTQKTIYISSLLIATRICRTDDASCQE